MKKGVDTFWIHRKPAFRSQ